MTHISLYLKRMRGRGGGGVEWIRKVEFKTAEFLALAVLPAWTRTISWSMPNTAFTHNGHVRLSWSPMVGDLAAELKKKAKRKLSCSTSPRTLLNALARHCTADSSSFTTAASGGRRANGSAACLSTGLSRSLWSSRCSQLAKWSPVSLKICPSSFTKLHQQPEHHNERLIPEEAAPSLTVTLTSPQKAWSLERNGKTTGTVADALQISRLGELRSCVKVEVAVRGSLSLIL